MTESKTIERRGGKRPGAGRPRKSTVTPTPPAPKPAGPVDPLQILEQIAADESAPATARVSAARALLIARAGSPEAAKEPEPKLVWISKEAARG